MKKILVFFIPIILIIGIISILFFMPSKKYTSPKEALQASNRSYQDFDSDTPLLVRKFEVLNEIAILPMGNRMIMYICYVCDTQDTSHKMVLFQPMIVDNGSYKVGAITSLYEIDEFENKSTQIYETGFQTLEYTVYQADAPELNDAKSKNLEMVNATFEDSKGVTQNVVFCYTYDIIQEK